MKGNDVRMLVKERRKEGMHFISWWRKEEDYIDFDLVDRFMENLDPEEEIGGFDLLTMDQMWDHVKKLCGDRVAKTQHMGENLLEWTVKGEVKSCPYNPDSLIAIFDQETRGNYVD